MTEEVKVSKRNILHMLGIAPVGVAALTIQPEDFTRLPGNAPRKDNPEVGVQNYAVAKYQPDKMARALEKLAANVRNHKVSVSQFHIGTNAVDNGRLTQVLTIGLEMAVKDEPIDDKEQSFANREGFYFCSGCHQAFAVDDQKLVTKDMQAWHLKCVEVNADWDLRDRFYTHFRKDMEVSVQDYAAPKKA